jgi:hypothetical protein
LVELVGWEVRLGWVGWLSWDLSQYSAGTLAEQGSATEYRNNPKTPNQRRRWCWLGGVEQTGSPPEGASHGWTHPAQGVGTELDCAW